MVDYSRHKQHHSMLDLCEALHSSNIGTGDPLDDETDRYFRRVLNDRLRNWTPARSPYDAAVRTLIQTVLSEEDWMGRYWSYMYRGDGLPQPKL